MKFLEIHPLYRDNIVAEAYVHGDDIKIKDLYKNAPPRVINLSAIKQLIPTDQGTPEDPLPLVTITLSDDYAENILVSSEEGERIKTILLSTEEQTEKLNKTLLNLLEHLTDSIEPCPKKNAPSP